MGGVAGLILGSRDREVVVVVVVARVGGFMIWGGGRGVRV